MTSQMRNKYVSYLFSLNLIFFKLLIAPIDCTYVTRTEMILRYSTQFSEYLSMRIWNRIFRDMLSNILFVGKYRKIDE